MTAVRVRRLRLGAQPSAALGRGRTCRSLLGDRVASRRNGRRRPHTRRTLSPRRGGRPATPTHHGPTIAVYGGRPQRTHTGSRPCPTRRPRGGECAGERRRRSRGWDVPAAATAAGRGACTTLTAGRVRRLSAGHRHLTCRMSQARSAMPTGARPAARAVALAMPPLPADRSRAGRPDRTVRATADGTATAVAVRRRRARPTRALRTRSSASTTRALAGRARGTVKVLITADTSATSWSTATRRAAAHAADRDARPPSSAQGAAVGHALAALPQGSSRSAPVSSRGGWPRGRRSRATREFAAGNQPMTLVPPGSIASRGRPRRDALGREADTGQPCCRWTATCTGVVPREVPPSWPAQRGPAPRPSAARTYAAFERARRDARTTTICDTDSCQVYGGVAPSTRPRTPRSTTSGRVALYQGQPAFTQFSSSNGGSELGRLAALPRRPARPLRGVVRQPRRRLDGALTSAADREGLALGRAPRRSMSSARDGHGRLRRPGHLGHADRHLGGRPPRSRSPATTSGCGSGSSRPGSSWRRR